jgi:hypothetical protein
MYGLNRSYEVKVEGTDLAAAEDAARSCSSADCGRRILSPLKSLDAYVDELATEKVADQVKVGCSAIWN